MRQKDYIIIGGGLAGTVCALSLIRRGKDVILFDDPSLSSSSKVAAGLFQPMTFKRTVESWKGFESITFSSEFYLSEEKIQNSKFFYPLEMFRVFSSYEEQNNWTLRSGDTRFSNLITEEKNSDADSCNIPFGYGKVLHAGYLDIPAFLKSAIDFLSQEESYQLKKMEYEQLEMNENEICYGGFSANAIIFCEGWLIKNNPWFSSIPMKPVKGEVLDITINEKKINSIISSGLFCVPRADGKCKVGSNYDWNNLDELPTEKIKSEFVSEISALLKTEVSVINHRAGVRPASNDRRPIIGNHPNHPKLYIFNGLGARGVALAPFTAQFLVNNLLSGADIPKEINVQRFAKL